MFLGFYVQFSYSIIDLLHFANTRYHGVELGQVSCGKQTFGCGI